MKASVLSIEGKKLREIELPKFFSSEIREDLIYKVLEAKKSRQPYYPMLLAGKQYSASGKIPHRRNVWKTHYKRGISRIPRKIITRKGSQFMWIGATIPGTRGGRRAHPPKLLSMTSRSKINKKEMKMALLSAISATAAENELRKKYSTLKGKTILGLPIIVEQKFLSLKTKEMAESLRKILGDDISKVAFKRKSIRSGRGKMRGRKHRKNAGAIIVLGNSDKMKAEIMDSSSAKSLSVTGLAKGGQGRLAIYTENAINDLNERFKENGN
jgi:large subunit ribosomal protein L4e